MPMRLSLTATDHRILNIALPSIVSNITVPLLGLVDMAIVGHMGHAAYIGAVAVGSMVFNLVYWLFAFLRMGSSGMTAQAYGRNDRPAEVAILLRALAIAMAIATALIVLQLPLKQLMFWLIAPTPDVAPLADTYFRIVIWGAPAMLALYALTGWFIGMQNTLLPMTISILQNVVNIVASLLLVYGLELKVEGVAMGTVVAQYSGLAVAVGLLNHHYGWWRALVPAVRRAGVSARQMLTVNRDIFLRTLCLVAVNLYFTSAGARQGAIILSVNTVMLQLYLFFSYFMDGFAFAGEAMGGRYYGAADRQAFTTTLRRLFGWAVAVTLAFTLAYVMGGNAIVSLLTDEPQVRATARVYLPWAWLVPAAGATAFIWDGIYIGITATRGMLVSSAVATATFYAIAIATASTLGNHGLWLAQVAYLAVRGLVQTLWIGREKWPI